MTAPTLTAPAGGAGSAGPAIRPDLPEWLDHVRSAAGCTRPIRLAGKVQSVEAGTGRVLSSVSTASMPDGVIYTACGNRLASVCPSCSDRYKRDAYQIARALMVGGDGVPDTVAQHPAEFATFTAPSFGPVHTRVVRRHTCQRRTRCDCRPEPCHARRDHPVCPHGIALVCYARHTRTDRRLGTPLCLDCYDHDAAVVWNLHAAELWRRTTEAIRKGLVRLARSYGLDSDKLRFTFGKVVEFQRRAAVHFHAIIRLDGHNPVDPEAIVPPPLGPGAEDLAAVVTRAAATVGFGTEPHPARPGGWPIRWGEPGKGLDVQPITVDGDGGIAETTVAAYVAKYVTKSTEVTGHISARLTADTIDLFANPDGTHTQRLIDACWILGRPREWRRLRLWAHKLGYGGHPFTKSQRHRVTFGLKRQQRVDYRRRILTTGPQPTDTTTPEPVTTLVVNFLQFVGAGWHTTADALLANTSAALARDHQQDALDYLTSLAA